MDDIFAGLERAVVQTCARCHADLPSDLAHTGQVSLTEHTSTGKMSENLLLCARCVRQLRWWLATQPAGLWPLGRHA